MAMNRLQADINRDDGIRRSELNAGSEWVKQAYRKLENYLTHFDQPFLAEDVRMWAESLNFPIPPHKRAWGGVFARACKAGLINKIGYRSTTNPNAHRTPATLWEAA